MVQNILFPDGIIYDKENDTFRTSSVNSVIALIAEFSSSYDIKKQRQADMTINLSPSVARGRVEPPTFGL